MVDAIRLGFDPRSARIAPVELDTFGELSARHAAVDAMVVQVEATSARARPAVAAAAPVGDSA
jgi:hypothetical protein